MITVLVVFKIYFFNIKLFKYVFSSGGFPYANVTNQELLAFLLAGQRLERPENCSEHLYELMLTCWAESADGRPEFAEIVYKLEPDFHKMIYVDFSELRHDYVFPPTLDQTQQVVLSGGVSPSASAIASEAITKH